MGEMNNKRFVTGLMRFLGVDRACWFQQGDFLVKPPGGASHLAPARLRQRDMCTHENESL
jgi:hypothetical protein